MARPVVKKRAKKFDADARTRPVKKKLPVRKMNAEESQTEYAKGGLQTKSRLPFRELKMCIADTLLRTMRFDSRDETANAEELAHHIAYSVMYEDGGFKVREEEFRLPRCGDCK